MTLADPFDLDLDGPPRDQWERPLLIPKAGGERIPYTRMSTLADFVTNDKGLTIWQRRLLAVGMGLREDLAAMVAGLPPLNDAKCDKSTLTKEQLEQDKATKKKLDEYIDAALEAAGCHWKANWGTAIHQFVENGSSDHAPARMKPDVESALEAVERLGLKVLASEVFVANDDLQAAGSFDHLVYTDRPGMGAMVLDVKTGQIRDKDLSFAIQISGYANADVYDWHDDSRAPLESLAGGLRVNRKRGLVCHVPLGGGRCDIYTVDLMRGYYAAQLASKVRTARSLSLMSKVDF